MTHTRHVRTRTPPSGSSRWITHLLKSLNCFLSNALAHTLRATEFLRVLNGCVKPTRGFYPPKGPLARSIVGVTLTGCLTNSKGAKQKSAISLLVIQHLMSCATGCLRLAKVAQCSRHAISLASPHLGFLCGLTSIATQLTADNHHMHRSRACGVLPMDHRLSRLGDV